eukprot:jgi/Botrbrau1/445/Bobra.110_2s0093.1
MLDPICPLIGMTPSPHPGETGPISGLMEVKLGRCDRTAIQTLSSAPIPSVRSSHPQLTQQGSSIFQQERTSLKAWLRPFLAPEVGQSQVPLKRVGYEGPTVSFRAHLCSQPAHCPQTCGWTC